ERVNQLLRLLIDGLALVLYSADCAARSPEGRLGGERARPGDFFVGVQQRVLHGDVRAACAEPDESASRGASSAEADLFGLQRPCALRLAGIRRKRLHGVEEVAVLQRA